MEDERGLLRTIISEHWDALRPILGRHLPEAVKNAVVSAVEKMLVCGTEANGFARFLCHDCGAVRIVAFKCKSRFCPDCGRSRAAEAAANAQGRLLNVGHRHLVFCVPSELRGFLFQNRKLLSVVAKSAAQATIHAIGTRCKANAPLPGVMATVHTFGRDLNFHPESFRGAVHVGRTARRLCMATGDDIPADSVQAVVAILSAEESA